jgi:hypothetical protein
MRWSISLCLTGLLFSMPMIAQASAESCGQMLLQPPAFDLYRTLGVNSAQASELELIKQDTARRQEALQYRLAQLRAETDQGRAYSNPEWLRHMEEQQIALEQQIEREQAMAQSRAYSVLSRWQRDRCAGQPVAYLPPPRRPVVVVHRPAPRVVRPIPRVVVRHAPPKAHRAPPAPKVKYTPAPKKHAPKVKVKYAPAPKVKVKYTQSKQGAKVAIKWGK